MRALIADENAMSRAALRAALIRVGFQVDEAQDELAATCILVEPDPPDLAFLAVETVLVDFASVCRAVQLAEKPVYVVALVPDSREHEVLSFLRAGADDYMVKGRPITAVQARLNVIRQNMARKAAGIGASADVESGSPDATDEAPETPSVEDSKALLEPFSLAAIARALKHNFGGLGLDARVVSGADDQSSTFTYSGWLPAFLLLGKTGEWVNIRLDFDDAALVALLQTSGAEQAPTESSRLTSIREVLNLLQAQLTAGLGRASQAVSFPLPPAAARADEIPPGLLPPLARKQSAVLALGESGRVNVSVALQLLKGEERPLTELKPFDVLATAVQAGRALTLLRAGVMLDDAYITRIRVFAAQREDLDRLLVFRPPSGTLLFLSKLKR